MTLKDLKFALELGCVLSEDIENILDFSKKNGINTQEIDKKLVELGYEKVFEDEFENEFDDDEFGYIEKFPHKSRFYED